MKKALQSLIICLTFGCASLAFAGDADNDDLLLEAVDSMLTDIKLYGPDALKIGDVEHADQMTKAMYMAYDASVNLLAHGINYSAMSNDYSFFKCGLRLDKHDTNLTYRRSDIKRSEIADFETAPKFYLSFSQRF